MLAFDFKEADCYLWFFCFAVALFTASPFSLSDSSYIIVCLLIVLCLFLPCVMTTQFLRLLNSNELLWVLRAFRIHLRTGQLKVRKYHKWHMAYVCHNQGHHFNLSGSRHLQRGFEDF